MFGITKYNVRNIAIKNKIIITNNKKLNLNDL
jgi:hypothetical protein